MHCHGFDKFGIGHVEIFKPPPRDAMMPARRRDDGGNGGNGGLRAIRQCRAAPKRPPHFH
jgi:hypothetical protein